MTTMAMLVLLATASAELGERPLKSAAEVGFTGSWGSVSESTRFKMREEAGYTWTFHGEGPVYAAWQARRHREINELQHYQERLDNFVQYTQTRSVVNFTRLGFDVVDIDPELHERIRSRLHEGLAKGARVEGASQGIFGDIQPQFVNHGEPTLLKQLQPIMEEWTPTLTGGLSAVTAYGMRVYKRGASMAFHADRVDTHVISGIFHIDHSYDDDDDHGWPIEIEGHDGQRHAVDLKPGQMLLYESAKCPHGRSKSLKGDYYASVFVHFKPKDFAAWPYTQKDIWLAVPPGWDKPPLSDHDGTGERWSGAFLTHDSMEVSGWPDRSLNEQHKRELTPNDDAAIKERVSAAKKAGQKPHLPSLAGTPAPPKVEEPEKEQARLIPVKPRETPAVEKPEAPKVKDFKPRDLDHHHHKKDADDDEDDDDEGDDDDDDEGDDDDDDDGDDDDESPLPIKPVVPRKAAAPKVASPKEAPLDYPKKLPIKAAPPKHHHKELPVKASDTKSQERRRGAEEHHQRLEARPRRHRREDYSSGHRGHATFLIAEVGGGFVVAGAMYMLGACAVLSTCGIFMRRAFATRGRSLGRLKKMKADDADHRSNDDKA